MTKAADLVAVATKEIGTAEKGDNRTKYGAFTKHDGQPWCGSFVMWCAAQIKQPMPNVVYTPAGVSAFQGLGRWANAATAKPKPGDIVFFDFVEGGSPVEHVGIVVKDNGDGTVTTIEGNTSPEQKVAGSQANGGEVAQRIRAYKKNNKRKLKSFVVGFGTPKWSKS
jgi:cell wall-associated NlpC family hydrolase